jgi:hypothetical protein
MNDWTTEIAKACQLMSYRFPLIVVRGVGFLLAVPPSLCTVRRVSGNWVYIGTESVVDL